MAALKTILSWFSDLFHGLLALWLLGVAMLALASGPSTVHLGMLPWNGPSLAYILAVGGLIALVCVALAITGRLKVLLFLWSVIVAVLLTKGYIFSAYRFGVGEWRNAGFLIAAVWVAVIGAWFQMRRAPSVTGPRQYRSK